MMNESQQYKYWYFLFIKKSVSDNLMFSPFSRLKGLISQNKYETTTKPYFLWSILFQNMKLQKCITQEPQKEGLHPKCQAFFAISDFYLFNPTSMDFLLDWIYIKRPLSLYIAIFSKNIFVLACFPLDNLKKKNK